MVFTGGGSFGGQVTVSGTMTLDGGTFSVADGTTIAAPIGGSGSLLLNAGSLTLGGSLTTTILTVVGGTLNGTGNLAAGSQVDWTGGDVFGSLTNAGTLTVAGTGNKFLYGPLTNAGTIAVTGSGTIYAEASTADITNQAGATFDFQAPADLDNYPFSLTFTNAGTLEQSNTSSGAEVDYAIVNTAGTGIIANDTSAPFVFDGGGSFGGQVTVSGTMTLDGGTFSVADGTTIAAPIGGSGSLLLNAGSLTLGGSLTTTILTVVGGTLNGTGNLAAGSQVDWTGGDVSGSLTNAGTLTVAGTGNKFLYGPLTNSGTIAVTGSGTIYAEASTADITNQAGATFDFQAPADLDNYPFSLTFTNAGTLEQSNTSSG